MLKPAIIVASLEQATAAAKASAALDVDLYLVSPPEGARVLGIPVFIEMMSQTQEMVPEARFEPVLDCGDSAGLAQAALAAGLKTICFTGPNETYDKLCDIAGQLGARVISEYPEALDFGSAGDSGKTDEAAAQEKIRDWLQSWSQSSKPDRSFNVAP